MLEVSASAGVAPSDYCLNPSKTDLLAALDDANCFDSYVPALRPAPEPGKRGRAIFNSATRRDLMAGEAGRPEILFYGRLRGEPGRIP